MEEHEMELKARFGEGEQHVQIVIPPTTLPSCDPPTPIGVNSDKIKE
jgi:hypothetical protein